MPPATRRIAILCGGGDCPGINAVIRAVAKPAIYHHSMQVLGVEDGFQGLVENRLRPLHDRDVSGILTQGGAILGSSNRCDPARLVVSVNPDGSLLTRDATRDCLETLRHHAIDALVVIGGDGTMTLARRFAEMPGFPAVIGVPKTIDNDLPGCEMTFGFLTAASTAAEALDRIHTTAASHHRAMFVEVMGRNAGWLALHAGLASGADIILLPEIPFDLAAVAERVTARRTAHKGFSIVCVAEGAAPIGGRQVVARVDPTSPEPVRLGGIAHFLASEIESRTSVESRAVVLGHVLRGGSPIPADRVLATSYGAHALALVAAGARSRLVTLRGSTITDIPLESCSGERRVPPDHPLLATAKAVGVSFGEGPAPARRA